MDALQALTTRRSASKLCDPEPPKEVLEACLEAAIRAPDHGRLRPWRFILIRGEGRRRLGRGAGRGPRRPRRRCDRGHGRARAHQAPARPAHRRRRRQGRTPARKDPRDRAGPGRRRRRPELPDSAARGGLRWHVAHRRAGLRRYGQGRRWAQPPRLHHRLPLCRHHRGRAGAGRSAQPRATTSAIGCEQAGGGRAVSPYRLAASHAPGPPSGRRGPRAR